MVGLTCPNLFALGAAIGHPDDRISSIAIGWSGYQIPRKPVFAVRIGSMIESLAHITNVIGPGQNFFERIKNISQTFSVN